ELRPRRAGDGRQVRLREAAGYDLEESEVRQRDLPEIHVAHLDPQLLEVDEVRVEHGEVAERRPGDLKIADVERQAAQGPRQAGLRHRLEEAAVVRLSVFGIEDADAELAEKLGRGQLEERAERSFGVDLAVLVAADRGRPDEAEVPLEGELLV